MIEEDEIKGDKEYASYGEKRRKPISKTHMNTDEYERFGNRRVIAFEGCITIDGSESTSDSSLGMVEMCDQPEGKHRLKRERDREERRKRASETERDSRAEGDSM